MVDEGKVKYQRIPLGVQMYSEYKIKESCGMIGQYVHIAWLLSAIWSCILISFKWLFSFYSKITTLPSPISRTTHGRKEYNNRYDGMTTWYKICLTQNFDDQFIREDRKEGKKIDKPNLSMIDQL